MGGGGCADDRNVLYSGGAGSDMGHVTTHRENTGRVTPAGGTETDGADVAAEPGQEMDVPIPEGGHSGYGRVGGGYIHRPPSEQRRKIYHKKDYYRPVSGGGAEPMILGIKEVVGTVGNTSRGYTGGGSGDRGGNGIGC